MDHNRKDKNGTLFSEWFRQMDRRELIETISQLCDAVIRDAGENNYRGGIRPGNIFRNEQGEITLGDGGMPQRSSWTAEQLEFISPEEFWNGEASTRSDVYSLGLLIYYCISGGKLPFQPDKKKLSAEERAKTVRRRMGGEPINAPEGSGKSLGSIIEKALSFRPEDRYTSVDDLPIVLKLCLKELDSPKPSEPVIEKTEEELSDAENMMVGIISKAAEEAALSDGEKKEAAAPEETESLEDIEVEIVDMDEEPEAEASGEEVPAENEPEETAGEAPAEEAEEPAPAEEAAAEETPAETPAEEVPAEEPAAVEEPAAEEPEAGEEAKPEEESDGKAAAAAAATAAAAAGTVLASKDERIGSGAGPRTPSKRPEKGQGNSRPAVSYQTGSKKPNPSSKKKKKKSYRGVLALLLLCALLVLAAIILHAITKHTQEPAEPTPTAVPTATQAAETDVVPEPPETSEPEPSEAPEAALTVYKEDSSWTAAESKCESLGGHLAVIHNEEELQEIISLAKQQGMRFIWIGCQRMSDGALHWVNGDAIDYYVWADGEPSLIGSGGESENYIMLWNTREDLTGEWVYNDVGNNPAMEYASTYSGRMGYILQTGN